MEEKEKQGLVGILLIILKLRCVGENLIGHHELAFSLKQFARREKDEIQLKLTNL